MSSTRLGMPRADLLICIEADQIGQDIFKCIGFESCTLSDPLFIFKPFVRKEHQLLQCSIVLEPICILQLFHSSFLK